MQQKLPFLKHIYGFPLQIIPDFSFWGGGKFFRCESSDIYPRRPSRLSFDRVDSAPSGVSRFFFFFFACLFLFCAVTARLHPER